MFLLGCKTARCSKVSSHMTSQSTANGWKEAGGRGAVASRRRCSGARMHGSGESNGRSGIEATRHGEAGS